MMKIELKPKKVEDVKYSCKYCLDLDERIGWGIEPQVYESEYCECKSRRFDTDGQDRFCYVVNITKEAIEKRIKETGEKIKIPSMLDVSNMGAEEFINLTLTTYPEEKKGYYIIYDFDIISDELYKKISDRDDFMWFRHFRDGFQNFVSTIVTPYKK